MLNKLHTTHRRINRQPTYIPTPSVQILITNVQESIALDTHIFIEKFVDANLNVNDCYKLINSFQRSNKLPACMTLDDESLLMILIKRMVSTNIFAVFLRELVYHILISLKIPSTILNSQFKMSIRLYDKQNVVLVQMLLMVFSYYRLLMHWVSITIIY